MNRFPFMVSIRSESAGAAERFQVMRVKKITLIIA